MKVEVNDRLRFACVWLTNEEKDDKEVRENLKPLYREYKAKKYKVAVFESGEKDLLEQTRALLSHNKNLAVNER